MTEIENKPVYVLYGSEAFLVDGYRKQIVDQLIGEGDPQMCVSQFDETAEPVVVLDELRTLPFLASHRVVIVRDADDFVKDNRDLLEQYLQSPCRTASLILLVSSWPKNTRLFKLVAEVGLAIKCSLDEKDDPGRQITAFASRRGKQIARDAVGMLCEWIGRDLGLLDMEIEKLSLYVGDRGIITAEDVAATAVATAGPVAFALTNALIRCDARASLTALDNMLISRGDEFRAIGSIAWHLRKVMQAQQLIQDGCDSHTALQKSRVFYMRNEFLSLLNRRSPEALQRDFRKLLAADLAMKSGTDPNAALQQLVVALCSG